MQQISTQIRNFRKEVLIPNNNIINDEEQLDFIHNLNEMCKALGVNLNYMLYRLNKNVINGIAYLNYMYIITWVDPEYDEINIEPIEFLVIQK